MNLLLLLCSNYFSGEANDLGFRCDDPTASQWGHISLEWRKWNTQTS